MLGQVFADALGALSPVWEQLPTRKVVFDSAVHGLNIGLLALGIVLTYRSTKVVNFAVDPTVVDRPLLASDFLFVVCS